MAFRLRSSFLTGMSLLGLCSAALLSGCASGVDNESQLDASLGRDADMRVDSSVRDAGRVDATAPDASPPDASRPDAMVGCVDEDGDGYGAGETCLGPDCDDTRSAVNPRATETCNGRDDNCDMRIDEGDAASLCPVGAQVASTICVAGACAVNSCVSGFGDCNRAYSDGCEQSLDTLTDCGACGNLCERAHASETCTGGECRVNVCDMGWGDCDAVDASGCEESLSSTEHCGMCGNRCEFDNATAACVGTDCSLLLCDVGYSNCDGVDRNGCELRHDFVSGSCASGVNLGAYDGDRSCGWPGCGSNTSWDQFAVRTGRSSAWFRATVREDSSCSATIEHQVRLEVPTGVDYDLFVYRSCGGMPLSSRGIAGADETLTISASDSFASDDDFEYFIEVRYFSGRSCDPWTLRVFGHDC